MDQAYGHWGSPLISGVKLCMKLFLGKFLFQDREWDSVLTRRVDIMKEKTSWILVAYL